LIQQLSFKLIYGKKKKYVSFGFPPAKNEQTRIQK